jgi:hypothetical protein
MSQPRYHQQYRHAEVALICDCVRRAQSLCFVGVAGSGKSNLTNLLHRDPYGYKPGYLGADVDRIHFPLVVGPTVASSAQSLWEAMATALDDTVGRQTRPAADEKIRQMSAEQTALSQLRAYLKELCQTRQQRVMFMLDDFDPLLINGPLPMLEQLAALRNDNRDGLSYLIFTKRLPHLLGQAHPLQDNSKFYDLFRHHTYALGLYQRDDAQQMVAFLNENNGRAPLSESALNAIIDLAGCHAGLLRILYDNWREASPTGDPVTYFAQQPAVQAECGRILGGLHDEEQQTALALARGQRAQVVPELVEHLAIRGLLIKAGNDPVWFSKIFQQYLAQP